MNKKMYYCDSSTPIGLFRIISCDDFIISSFFLDSVNNYYFSNFSPFMKKNDLLLKASLELEEWFSGGITTFSIPLLPEGSVFQKKYGRFY